MNCTPAEARALAEAVETRLPDVATVDVVLCPPFLAVPTVAETVRGTALQVGAQNAYWLDQGAFTGEVSMAMLEGIASYVISGHSERRHWFGEDDETVRKKSHAALLHGLVPIVCVGEHLHEFEAGATHDVLHEQIRGSLAGIDSHPEADRLVIAYEPVWAIGTGKAATPEMAQATIAFIRAEIGQMFGPEMARSVRIQYGGSVTSGNAEPMFAQPDIDGALVSGASLKPDDFASIVRAALSPAHVSWGNSRC